MIKEDRDQLKKLLKKKEREHNGEIIMEQQEGE